MLDRSKHPSKHYDQVQDQPSLLTSIGIGSALLQACLIVGLGEAHGAQALEQTPPASGAPQSKDAKLSKPVSTSRSAEVALEVFADVVDIAPAKQKLAKLVAEAKKSVSTEHNDTLLSVQHVLAAIHPIAKSEVLIQDDCVDRALRYLAIGEALKLPMSVVTVGSHVVINWKGGYFDLTWEPLDGRYIHPDYLRERFCITEDTIKNGVFFSPLTTDELKSIALGTVAEMHRTKGDSKKALAALDRSITLNPKNALALAFRGTLLAEQKNTEAALRDLREATRLYPAHDTALWQLGHMYNQRGEFDASVKCFDQLLRYWPHQKQAREARDFIADKRSLEPIIHYLAAHSDHQEHTVYYFPQSAKLVDVSRNGDAVSVGVNWEIVKDLPADEDVLIVHNHRLTRSAYLKMMPLSAEERARVERLDLPTFERRILANVPSPADRRGEGGDIDMAIFAEQRRLERAPRASSRHFIICFGESSEPQAVEFGLTPKSKREYAGAVLERFRLGKVLEEARANEKEDPKRVEALCKLFIEAAKKEDEIKLSAVRDYQRVWLSYASEVLKPYSEGPGREPALEDLTERLEKARASVFLKNYGPFPRGKK